MRHIKDLLQAVVLAALFALPFIVYLYNMTP
jgi:hypothetical protein